MGTDADVGLTGVDAEDVVGGAEGHAPGLAGLHDDAAEAGAAVRIRRRHLVVEIFREHERRDINLRTFPLNGSDCGTRPRARRLREGSEVMVQTNTSTKTRRTVLSMAGAGLGAVALAACGQEAGEGQTSTGAQATGQITFLGRESGSEVAVYKEGIEKFNASQARVKVMHDLATGNFDQKLQTLVAAGRRRTRATCTRRRCRRTWR
jgi:hypothetical protein